MTEAEWIEFAGRLEATFRGGLQDDREHELRRHFGMVPFDLAEKAISTLVRGTLKIEPQVFVPTAAELIAALRYCTSEWVFAVAMSGLSEADYTASLYHRHNRQLTAGGDDG